MDNIAKAKLRMAYLAEPNVDQENTDARILK